MHHITSLKSVSKELAQGLKVLKGRIEAADISPSQLDESFNLATWNIREFGKTSRSVAAIHYIAEILGQFDLIAVGELRDDLRDLARVLQILGPYWKAVYSDAVMDPGGNRERIAYIYDKRQISFNGMASAAYSPRTKKGTEWIPDSTWWRPPYIASFKSGNFDFVVLSTHIRWGEKESGRTEELSNLAKWVDDKVKLIKKGGKSWTHRDIFVMGDFNIPSRRSPLFDAITSRGLQIPNALLHQAFGSNLEKNKWYDQILHLPGYPDNFSNKGGVLDFYCGDHTPLFDKLTKQQFTYQISDHLPLWIQVNTDIDGFELDQIIKKS
ncbi:endonuclease/exonuclease/phosphatase family metal-dependent hydrolase [Herbaspirillum sp. Sphag1AN]|uniref:endonuclease/exonuclease/phosphatase family protein n=1 Tax=unclassified Herbaspirillum TaxID=2624150 RepID=UPI0016161C13|nr:MULTISPECIES: endonuclease/exonuclease/phosphatase family protein [unclassified Herbaspirillum]MBB3213296.1 endonuclease/exonuclease/phosphatase family metal-dependent hydrolase [Herbaspirillum sp. Sphag1AN]MBB3246660.1 endonuclease/exonuclease/phosphatase family metal-dependent hydrolase [Herbaspirillum sp. Sphag64]